MGVDLIF